MRKPVLIVISSLFALNSASFVVHSMSPSELCQDVKCKAGRECRVLSSGYPECVCKAKCPENGRPVCGSDGILYESHCDLHREACLKGEHIRPKFLDHSCLEDPLAKLKREIDKAMEVVKQREMQNIKVPRTCHQNHRNRMREYWIRWMTMTASKNDWYKSEMSYQSIVDQHFNVSDIDGDGQVNSQEWFKYLRKKNEHLKRDKKTRRLRKLCIEALIEEADRNQDWRLSRKEYQKLMDKKYQPSNKYCIRDRIRYEDGTKTKVDCNGCTCACGKWICTSHPCGGTGTSVDTKNSDLYDDMDNLVD